MSQATFKRIVALAFILNWLAFLWANWLQLIPWEPNSASGLLSFLLGIMALVTIILASDKPN